MSSRGLAGLFALVLGVSLVLGTAPREAQAVACRKLNQPAGCVVPRDLKKNAVKAKNRLDEAGTDFVSLADTAAEISTAPKVYATVVVDAPAAGTVIVNASITIQAIENPGPGIGIPDGQGSVECALTSGGNVIATSNPNRFFGSVDWDDGLEYETIAITRGFTLSRKISSTIALACRAIPGSGSSTGLALLRVRAPNISAAYYANLPN